MTEQQRYDVLERFPGFELRSYPAHLVAFADAGNRAFGVLVAWPSRFARFDPPWTPWFLRRNEVVLPVETSTSRRNPN